MTNPTQSDESAPISVEAIMDDIRARVGREPPVAGAGVEATTLPSTPAAGSGGSRIVIPPPIHPAPADNDLYTALLTAHSSADVSALPLFMANGRRGLGGAVRAALHNLMLYYVNMLAEKQTAFNRAIVSTAARMVDQMENRDIERITALEREVRELKAELKRRDQRS